MKNTIAIERIEQACDANVDKLVWVAASFDQSALKDMIEDLLCFNRVKEAFPDFNEAKYEDADNYDSIREFLVDTKKFGFIAQVFVPICKNFMYENGSKHPWTWSSGSASRVVFIYAESTDELVRKIEKAAKALFNEFMEYDKKKEVKGESN